MTGESEATSSPSCFTRSRRLGHDFDEGHWQRARRCREHAWDCQEHLRRLGLDHFEDRSWRGFHHHVCLVALAPACARRDA
jgi:SRSO17 transposase